MEVHHHPNIHHNKRRFKEYISEFIMIFLAITMGFLAENLREHFSEKHREKEYMKSMLEDLKSDTSQISSEIKFSKIISTGLDSLASALYSYPSKTSIAEIYRMHYQYTRMVGVTFSDQASTQLKSGGMSFVKNPEIAMAIARYWQSADGITMIQENFRTRLVAASDVGYGIFNTSYVHLSGVDTVTYLAKVWVDTTSKLMTNDAVTLVSYANRISLLARVLKTFYLQNMNLQYKTAEELIELIKKEYRL